MAKLLSIGVESNMAESERLLNLLKEYNVCAYMDCEACLVTKNKRHCIPKDITDYLLKNGVIVPPCKVGETIYVIPSKTNFRLNKMHECTKDNNRVYEQKVYAIEIYLSGYTLTTCDELQSQPNSMYGETWFLSREEAEQALKNRG